MPRLTTTPSRLKPSGTRSIGTQPAVNPDSWRSGLSSAERGYDHRWRKARDGYLMKHPLCVYCLRDGRTTAANVVDHIVPHRGDKLLFWDSSNWQSLCDHCHNTTKKREELLRDSH